MELPDQFRVLH